MMSQSRWIMLTLLATLLAADTVSAGLFDFGCRRWQRRKDELRAELLYDLEQKLDHDLAMRVEAVSADLNATAEAQLQAESDRLSAQVEQAVAQLREEAANLVAAEAERLDMQLDAQLKALTRQAQNQFAVKAKKLSQQADQQITALTQKYSEESQALRSTLDQQIANLPQQINAQVERALEEQAAKKLKAAPVDASTDAPEQSPAQDTPEPSPDDQAAPDVSALPSKEVELTDTVQGS